MLSKSTKSKKLKNDFLETSKNKTDCKVSQASNEIMLYRIYDGKVIEFPFSQ